MLKSIRLINFQSHIDSLIELDKGITALTGESHEGKTAIQRGLNWAINNEPVGTGFISYWAKHKTTKGMTVIDIPCKVECIREDGSILIRERSADFNGYRIDGKDLGRAGVGVPSEVKQWFNMSEVNIQNQHDSLFLLHPGGKGGQEVARFLNSVVKLDEIPRALSAIESKKRSVKKLKETETEKIKTYEKTLKDLEWVAKADSLQIRMEKLDKSLIGLKAKGIQIGEEIVKYNELKEILASHTWTKRVIPLLERWTLVTHKEETLFHTENNITESLASLKRNQQYLKNHKWIDAVKKEIEKLYQTDMELMKMISNYNLFKTQLNHYNTETIFLKNTQPWLQKVTNTMTQFEKIDYKINELESKEFGIATHLRKIFEAETLLSTQKRELKIQTKKLPARCPLCNQPWKGDKHESSR